MNMNSMNSLPLGTPPRGASEATHFLAQHPQVSQILLILTDINGIARGKLVRPHELESLYTQGRPLPSSILSLNVLGEDVDSTGLVWEVGDMDCLARPVPGTLKPCPWLADTAQLLLSMDPEAGQPAAAADPRLALVRVVDGLGQDGLHPVLACELEFYLLDADGWQRGEVQPARSSQGHSLSQTQVYGVHELEAMRPFFSELYRCSRIQGLPAETAISEYAPGQFEVTLTHRASALQAVDEAVQFKRLIKGVADRHGMLACFMAKPFSARAGSGMHIHVSLNDEKGNNRFASADPAGNALMHHAIGGMAATITDAMAIFAPHANSYRRFRRSSYAPTAATWGVNNRSVTFRVPTGAPPTRHVEHRASGADANPYLAAAAVLAGLHYGIRTCIDPGPALQGNAYEQAQQPLNLNWYATLYAFEQSDFIRSYFGAPFQRIFTALKREQCERFYSEVTTLDHDWHLRLA
ncbi:MAG TPA: glutamine synthetase family protein [Thiolinea sp.]|nr:glutamine synthetase family protein [Thiolinea sp.]